MKVELFPSDANNQRTINQGRPPNWQNPAGGDYELVATSISWALRVTSNQALPLIE